MSKRCMDRDCAGSRVQRSGSQGVNLKQMFGREREESAKSHDTGRSVGSRSDGSKPDAPRNTMSALGKLFKENLEGQLKRQRRIIP